MDAIIWFPIAFLIVAPAVLGVYVLAAPADKLGVSYQNYRLAKTGKPLKDEDFSHLPWLLVLMKAGGVAMIAFSALVLAWAI